MGKEEFTHSGRILEVLPSVTTVTVLSEAACSSCHARSLCGAADSREKIISVPTDPYALWAPGDEVEVVVSRSLGNRAVWLAYAVPLALMLAVIGGLLAAGVAEWAAGLGGLGTVALWYLVLLFMKKRLAKDFSFRIRRKNTLS